MKTKKLMLSMLVMALSITMYGQSVDKLISTKTHIKFFSHTSVEDIEANNYASVGTVQPETGEVIFSVPMQSFEFEKALMQKHFNSDNFLDTKAFPKSKLKAKIVNLSAINFAKNGSYPATVEGELTIKGVTSPVTIEGIIKILDGTANIESMFNVTLADYGITFSKGKPSTNVAKIIEVTVHAELSGKQ